MKMSFHNLIKHYLESIVEDFSVESLLFSALSFVPEKHKISVSKTSKTNFLRNV